jgi:hypothetical protein
MAERHVTLEEVLNVIADWDNRYFDKDGNPNLVKQVGGFRFKVVVSRDTAESERPFVITVTKDPQ